MFAGDAVLDLNGDPAAQNALLRRLRLRVDMDATMAPHVQWVIDPDAARAQELAMEAEYSEPDETGESQNDRELSPWMTERYGTPEKARAALRRARKGATDEAGSVGAG